MSIQKTAIYKEKLSSKKTENLFITLMLIFLVFTLWRASSYGLDGTTITCAIFFLFFLFYVVNYKVLIICIFPEKLKLQFGIFSWVVPFENIVSCGLDNNIPTLKKYGGAGIHFMMVRGRYRVSFNFLEYKRVVVKLKKKQGWVQDVSFSTQQPSKFLKVLQEK
ncbi:MAG: hypothetical protein HN855_09220 [Anaerolineae bacterium]|jgi:hypothetical protein|nr:hypothetical protein [Anaerolineae bacterium]MBT7073258.1 hypothetical protein [Anaerolineae bacterium]MBT7325326.1 hypothetical protein [Anaerolineae bacterium]